jgi:tetrapyrrole methylase family protein/MazG family protein
MTQNNAGNKSGDEAVQAFIELRETVARLRAEDGCPWDRAQTHETLKPECVEEAAEVICGINILRETGSPDSLIEELGDLLLQVVMHAQIAEEEGLFTLEDVIRGINEKMIRRHPHVFGEESLKYLPEAYKSACTAAESSSDENAEKYTEKYAENPSKKCTELQKDIPDDSRAVLVDWQKIKYYEKHGREWEEEYLFRAFDEAEELIKVARKRKLEKRN